MSVFDSKESDLEPLRDQIIETSGIDPAAIAGYVVIVCTNDADGKPGAALISSSRNVPVILSVVEAIAADIRQQMAAQQ